MCKTVDDFSQIKRREGFAHFHSHFYVKMLVSMWPQYLPLHYYIGILKNFSYEKSGKSSKKSRYLIKASEMGKSGENYS